MKDPALKARVEEAMSILARRHPQRKLHFMGLHAPAYSAADHGLQAAYGVAVCAPAYVVFNWAASAASYAREAYPRLKA